jgi:hypothetical protein
MFQCPEPNNKPGCRPALLRPCAPADTLYECDFSSDTLVLGDSVVTISADLPRLQTSDFLLV